ncbi:uncharacterized protein VTP21DRAFT_2350 [Calcarisporiella thermophila]|uniref:uncharacterized protein n=1 Tax=Calcarisporiella thermophila TaxID=911321 RepID=UPI003742A19E
MASDARAQQQRTDAVAKLVRAKSLRELRNMPTRTRVQRDDEIPPEDLVFEDKERQAAYEALLRRAPPESEPPKPALRRNPTISTSNPTVRLPFLPPVPFSNAELAAQPRYEAEYDLSSRSLGEDGGENVDVHGYSVSEDYGMHWDPRTAKQLRESHIKAEAEEFFNNRGQRGKSSVDISYEARPNYDGREKLPPWHRAPVLRRSLSMGEIRQVSDDVIEGVRSYLLVSQPPPQSIAELGAERGGDAISQRVIREADDRYTYDLPSISPLSESPPAIPAIPPRSPQRPAYATSPSFDAYSREYDSTSNVSSRAHSPTSEYASQGPISTGIALHHPLPNRQGLGANFVASRTTESDQTRRLPPLSPSSFTDNQLHTHHLIENKNELHPNMIPLSPLYSTSSCTREHNQTPNELLDRVAPTILPGRPEPDLRATPWIQQDQPLHDRLQMRRQQSLKQSAVSRTPHEGTPSGTHSNHLQIRRSRSLSNLRDQLKKVTFDDEKDPEAVTKWLQLSQQKLHIPDQSNRNANVANKSPTPKTPTQLSLPLSPAQPLYSTTTPPPSSPLPPLSPLPAIPTSSDPPHTFPTRLFPMLDEKPRQCMCEGPVLQVINRDFVKDRYLFLLNDVLLIVKPQVRSLKKQASRMDEPFELKKTVKLSNITLIPTRDSEEEHSVPTRWPPALAAAIRRFSTNAKAGIDYLISKGALPRSPAGIARFLLKTADLNRTQLGLYLSMRENHEILQAFFECFQLTGLRLDEAWRLILLTVRLPQDRAAADYFMEAFCARWHSANPDIARFNIGMTLKVLHSMMWLNARVYEGDASVPGIPAGYVMDEPTDSEPEGDTEDAEEDFEGELGSPSPHRYLRRHWSFEIFVRRFRRWEDPYAAVPREFLAHVYSSVRHQRMETAWDDAEVDAEDALAGHGGVGEIYAITMFPPKLPTRLVVRRATEHITLSIPRPDAGLWIRLHGQGLYCKPSVLDFSQSSSQSFTITGISPGRTSLLILKAGRNAHRYALFPAPLMKTLVVERAFMQHTFQIEFSMSEHEAPRRYMFSVDSAEVRDRWLKRFGEALANSSKSKREDNNEGAGFLDAPMRSPRQASRNGTSPTLHPRPPSATELLSQPLPAPPSPSTPTALEDQNTPVAPWRQQQQQQQQQQNRQEMSQRIGLRFMPEPLEHLEITRARANSSGEANSAHSNHLLPPNSATANSSLAAALAVTQRARQRARSPLGDQAMTTASALHSLGLVGSGGYTARPPFGGQNNS